MSRDLRVPPGVTYDFEQVANEVCEKARLDYDDWNEKRRELVSYFQGLWCEFADQNLSTEAAEERVLEMFGDVRKAAKSLRRPWIERLFCYRRFQPQRAIVFFGSYVFIAWLTLLDVYYRKEYEGNPVDIDQLMLPFDWKFFWTGFGQLGLGFLGFAAARLIQWKPLLDDSVSRVFSKPEYLFGLLLLPPFWHLLVRPTILTVITIRQFEAYFYYVGFCGVHFLGILVGVFGTACLLADIFTDSQTWKKFWGKIGHFVEKFPTPASR